ncbi:PucR family transcriptional regulator [Streptomyces sp. A7024]|uniref:PucR family transcriptional regulator n=1 Tax=Streptomyces coryli TaxID=1128680 RepID=A0A6G4U1G5_9ACTN|nr:helix-turn-helix domain-containing protein [Streptomyces coryli]NGN66075.1 PucR family transcriptional regulator [Streptomyces coryli]
MRGDYQYLVDEISAALQSPATLEDRDFGLIAFGVHEAEDDSAAMDPVRTKSILTRRSTAAVKAWFEAYGIARARGPVRIAPDPSAGVLRGRICLPARHAGVVQGYVWLLDDGHLAEVSLGDAPGTEPDPRIVRAMETADRIGALLAAEARSGAEAGALLRELISGPVGGRDAAGTSLATMLGASGEGPLAMVAVLPWETDEAGPSLPGAPGVAALCDVRVAAGGGRALAALVRLRGGALDPAREAARRLLESPRAARPEGGAAGGPPGGATGAAPRAARSVVGSAGQAPGGSATRSDGGSTRASAASARSDAGSARSGAGSARSGAGSARASAASARSGAGTARSGSAQSGAGSARSGPGPAAAPPPLGAGVSAPRQGTSDLAAAWREAYCAARAARADERLGPVVEWGDAGAYRLLTWLPAGTPTDPAVRKLLLPAHAELARTAEIFLDHAGQAGRTATALGIHRQTLYYRLSRVEEFTGLDLDDGEHRLLLHMALKAARL